MWKLLVILGAIFCTAGHAQVKFENGYFIDNAGRKTNCLIRNSDWNNNPRTFEYKMTEPSETLKASIEDVGEFGISDLVIYKRFSVQIDRSSSKTQSLSTTKAPEFNNETLYLKVLVQGKASLYQFIDDGLLRFFYSTDSTGAAPLVYKEYRTNNTRAANNTYRQQLWNELRCGDVTEREIQDIDYNTASLIKYFTRYNNCLQSPVKVFSQKSERITFNFSIRPGIVFSSLVVSNTGTGINNVDFGNASSLRIGLEAELILPFNNKKWSFLLEPTYQQFSSDVQTNTRKLDYSSIEFPIGARRYFFLGDRSKLFLNFQCLFEFPLQSSVEFYANDLEVKSNVSLVGGVGYNLKSKFSFELRYQANRQLFFGYTSMDTDFEGIAIILGYTF